MESLILSIVQLIEFEGDEVVEFSAFENDFHFMKSTILLVVRLIEGEEN